MYMYVHVAYVCWSPQRWEEGVRSPEKEVTLWVLETEHRFSERTISVLNHQYISPDPENASFGKLLLCSVYTKWIDTIGKFSKVVFCLSHSFCRHMYRRHMGARDSNRDCGYDSRITSHEDHCLIHSICFSILFCFIYLLGVYVCAHMHAMAHMWRSKDIFSCLLSCGSQ